MDGFTWAWILWALAFVGIEGAALANKRRGDTLSEHVWRIRAHKAGRWGLAAFLGWLVYHFLVEGP